MNCPNSHHKMLPDMRRIMADIPSWDEEMIGYNFMSHSHQIYARQHIYLYRDIVYYSELQNHNVLLHSSV